MTNTDPDLMAWIEAHTYTPNDNKVRTRTFDIFDFHDELKKLILEAKNEEIDGLRREFRRTTWEPYNPDSIFSDRLDKLNSEDRINPNVNKINHAVYTDKPDVNRIAELNQSKGGE